MGFDLTYVVRKFLRDFFWVGGAFMAANQEASLEQIGVGLASAGVLAGYRVVRDYGLFDLATGPFKKFLAFGEPD